jgi:hypothetical protein
MLLTFDKQKNISHDNEMLLKINYSAAYLFNPIALGD